MSAINKTNLEIRIVDVDRRPVNEATVLGGGTHTRPLGPGRYSLPNLPKGRIKLRIEAKDYSPVEFSVEVFRASTTVHSNARRSAPSQFGPVVIVLDQERLTKTVVADFSAGS